MAASGGGTIANLQVNVAANVAAALVGFNALQGAITAVVDTIKEFVSEGVDMNAFMESSQLQFKTLTGSARVAQEQLKDLFDLAAHTPFTFQSVVVASRQLEVFGGAALDTHDNLVMLGDAAAATGAPIEQVTFWTGRLYSQLQAGRPIGEALRWLQRMGVVSGEARQQLDTMSKAGATATEMWDAFSQAMGRFSGAMKAQEQTWQGLTSTMGDLFKLWEAQATKGLFTQLEQEVREFNRVLASPAAMDGAKAISGVLEGLADPFVRLTEILTGDTEAILKNAGAWDDWHRAAFAAQQQAERNAAKWVDLRTAGEELQRQLQQDAADTVHLADVTENLTRAQEEAKKAGSTVAEMFRDESERALQYAGSLDRAADAQNKANDALARAKAVGDSGSRGADQATHDAEMQRLYEEGQALAHQGDIQEIINREEVSAAQFRQQQLEKIAKITADNEQKAYQQAADAIRQKNQETADAIRRQQEAAQEAVRRAYVETADEAERQYDRIKNASKPVTDTLSQDIDEATNRQVREGIYGTADAMKQLDDIRKEHLKTLPDLTALDKEYAAAQQDSRDKDLAVAAAQRDLDKALAATGGQQTLQTAALAHNVTAAKLAADAAHDHERALAAERSQAIADTNALKDLAAARNPGGGGLGLPDIGGPFSSNAPLGSVARLAGFSRTGGNIGIPVVQPVVVHVNVQGSVVGVDQFGKAVTDAVQQADRSNSLNLTRYATR